MSHISIIIRSQRSTLSTGHADSAEPEYSYELPVPHGATPQQVGELVRRAYKRLESHED